MTICRLCHDTGFAFIYAGCIPGVREHNLKVYQGNGDVLFRGYTIPCVCMANKNENSPFSSWLREMQREVVLAWTPKPFLNDEQYLAVVEGESIRGWVITTAMNGQRRIERIADQVQWQTAASDFEF